MSGTTEKELVLEIDPASSMLAASDLSAYYGANPAITHVSLSIPERSITAFVGPSGCGKSTLLRSFNRMNELFDGYRHTGQVWYGNVEIHDREVDVVELRRQVGMVFQKATPFACSIYDNVAFGARVNNYSGDMDSLVEQSLKQAALWTEVKDRLKSDASSLSGGQQQRLCIARALAVEPTVLLLDEPCSALDPISTAQIETLLRDLKEKLTIIIVTHNMQQARRISDYTAFLNVDIQEGGIRIGHLVEFNHTEVIFESAGHQSTRDYVSGQFG